MLKELLADGARGISEWCLERSKRWSARAGLWADISEWFSTFKSWADIRRSQAKRGRR